MTLPEKLKAWRERKNFTQAEAAESLGLSIDTLQNWEIGRRKPQGLAMTSLLEKISPQTPAPKSAARPRRESNQHKQGTRTAIRGGNKKSNHEKTKR